MNTSWLSRLMRTSRFAAPSLATSALGGLMGYGLGNEVQDSAGQAHPWMGAGIGAAAGGAVGQLPRMLSRAVTARGAHLPEGHLAPGGPWWQGVQDTAHDTSLQGLDKVIWNPSQVVSGVNPYGADGATRALNARAWGKLSAGAKTLKTPELGELRATEAGQDALRGYDILQRQKVDFRNAAKGGLKGLQEQIAEAVAAGKATAPDSNRAMPGMGRQILSLLGRGAKWLRPNSQDAFWGVAGGVSQAARDMVPGMNDDSPQADLVGDAFGVPGRALNAGAKWLAHRDDPEGMLGGKRWGRAGNAISHGLLSMMAHRVGRGLPNVPARYMKSDTGGDQVRVDPSGVRWAGTRASQAYALGGPWSRTAIWPWLNRGGKGLPEQGINMWKALTRQADKPIGDQGGAKFRSEIQPELQEPEQPLGGSYGLQFKEQSPAGVQLPAEDGSAGFGLPQPDVGQPQLPMEVPATKSPIPPLKGNPLAPTGKPRPEFSPMELEKLNDVQGTRLSRLLGPGVISRPEVHKLLFTPDGGFKPLWWEDRATIDEIGRVTGKPMLWDEMQKAMTP